MDSGDVFITHKPVPFKTKLKFFKENIRDRLALAIHQEVKPCFTSISVVTFKDHEGIHPKMTHYSIDGDEICKEKGIDIRNLIPNNLREHSWISDNENTDEWTYIIKKIAASKIPDKTMVKVNKIVREAIFLLNKEI